MHPLHPERARPAARERSLRRPPAALLATSLLTLLLLPGARVLAADYRDFSVLSQDEFRLVGEDLGRALSWKGIEPAEQLGVLGFDVGIGLQASSLQHADLLRRTAGGAGPSTLWIPTLRVHKGLPLNIDLGATYGRVIGTNVSVWGIEGRWAFVPGNVVMPAVALRAATAGISGIDALGLQSTNLELTASKGIGIFTPYAGIGRVWSNARPHGVPALHDESFSYSRYYAGLNVNLGWNFAIGLGRTGGATSIGLKTGFRFASWL